MFLSVRSFVRPEYDEEYRYQNYRFVEQKTTTTYDNTPMRRTTFPNDYGKVKRTTELFIHDLSISLNIKLYSIFHRLAVVSMVNMWP